MVEHRLKIRGATIKQTWNLSPLSPPPNLQHPDPPSASRKDSPPAPQIHKLAENQTVPDGKSWSSHTEEIKHSFLVVIKVIKMVAWSRSDPRQKGPYFEVGDWLQCKSWFIDSH